MALTTELLTANAALGDLTDAQKAVIVEMSQNDEAAVIGQKTGEIYGRLDADILAASGAAKNGTEKTYDYAKRVIGEMKSKVETADALQQQVAGLEKEKTRLEGIIAKGAGDEETKKALSRAQADLANVTAQYTELKAKYDASEAEHAKVLMGVRIDTEFASAGKGLKFKKDLPQTVVDLAVKTAVDKVKAMNPEFIDDGKGGKVLAFMENGTPKRNPDTNLKPYTAAELVEKELRGMGILEAGRQQVGAGSDPNGDGGKGNGPAADLTGARTQAEASDVVRKMLLSQGIAVTSAQYQKEYDRIWKENTEFIKSLPLQ